MEILTSAEQPMEFQHLMEVAVQPSEVHVKHTHTHTKTHTHTHTHSLTHTYTLMYLKSMQILRILVPKTFQKMHCNVYSIQYTVYSIQYTCIIIILQWYFFKWVCTRIRTCKESSIFGHFSKIIFLLTQVIIIYVQQLT